MLQDYPQKQPPENKIDESLQFRLRALVRPLKTPDYIGNHHN